MSLRAWPSARLAGLIPDLADVRGKGVVLVGCQDESLRAQAMGAAAAMRAAGVDVDLVLEPKKFKWIMKHADRKNAAYAVVLAPREAEQGLVGVKRMADGQQEDVPIDGLAEWMTKAQEGK